jgi:hypothetical protein
MIAFHFPPCRGSSGLQRTLSFSRYLPRFGWHPIVLSANPNAYPDVGEDQVGDIPSSTIVNRAFALDAARHLSIRGRYLGWSALPDRWVSWVLGAVPAGLQLIRRYKPRVLWTTHPIPTAHLLGFILRRLTGLPWVADFRDPMTEFDSQTQRRFPNDPTVWQARSWVERMTIKHCTRAVFVAPTTMRMYADRYPETPGSHWALIPNGYNEENFSSAECSFRRPSQDRSCLLLLHSGLLYRTDRDPSAFFSALANLLKTGRISPSEVQVVFRATGHDDHYRQLIAKTGIGEIVTLQPVISYREALGEMLDADGLLIFQGQESNANIPAKLYEYLRAQRPILALVDPQGDTARALRAARVGTIVPMHSVEQISNGLLEFLKQVRAGTCATPSAADVMSYSRATRTKVLAKLFDTILS